MKVFKIFFSVIFLCLSCQLTYAQEFCIGYDVITITPTEFVIDVKLQLSAAGNKLGTSTLIFSYNGTNLSNPTMVTDFLAPTGLYSPTLVKKTNPSAEGLASISVLLSTINNGTAIAFAPAWTPIVRMHFNSTGMSTSSLAFSLLSDVFKDDEATSFTANPACLPLDVPLPLEWLDFRATTKTERGAKIVNLDWVTASERNIQYFVVERSQDGKSFVQVGANVTASNKSTKNAYHVEDSNPLAGLSFYRIHEATLGGKNSYSLVRSVDIVKEKGLLSVYPNPSDSDISIEMEINKNAGDVFVEIFDMVGKQIYFKKIAAETERMTIPIPTMGLPDGTYVIRVKNGANIWQHKIVKN